MSGRWSHAVAVVLACVVVAACVGDSRAGSGAEPPSDTVIARPLSLIGELEGPEEYLFGDVGSVAVSSAGVVYIADRMASTVRAYDTAGHHLALVGRAGEGPGEFTAPNDLTFDPSGRLYVRGQSRVTVFDPPERGGVAHLVAGTIPLPGYGRPLSTRGRADGRLYYFPSYYYFMFLVRAHFYQVLDASGPTGDTVPILGIPDPAIFGRANYPIPDGGRPVEGINTAPFEPRPSWDITRDGHVVTSPGGRYEVVEWGPDGDTVRVIRIASAPRPVPPGERRDSARAFDARLDTIPVPLDEVRAISDAARNRDLPDVYPEVLAVHVDADGRIWVRRWGAAGASVFDVLDATGAPLATIRVPADLASDPPPWVSGRFVAGVVRDPVTEVERVGVFGFELPVR